MPTGQIGVTVLRDGSSALVTVRDTGSGIPASELPHVFERFRRAPETRREERVFRLAPTTTS